MKLNIKTITIHDAETTTVKFNCECTLTFFNSWYIIDKCATKTCNPIMDVVRPALVRFGPERRIAFIMDYKDAKQFIKESLEN